MAVSAALVKELRDKTGAGMMDCKNTLEETQGDVEKAVELLRKKGIASAEKRSGRATKEGLIESYIHAGSRLGVLVELNCETDFVARTDDFKQVAKDIAMHVAAASPLVVTREELDPAVIEREKDIFATQARNEGKPDNIVEKISTGKLEKFYSEVCLEEQQFVKDPQKTVKEMLKEVSGKLGENMGIRRFCRFQLGQD
jgi:elongation factor Ts